MKSVDNWKTFKCGELVRCCESIRGVEPGDEHVIKDIQLHEDGLVTFMFLIQGDFFHLPASRFEKIPDTERKPL